MRQLKPEVAAQRKRDLLQWVIHYYIKTSRPVSSAVIAEEGRFDLSSATIRNILQELENEGFLQQPHTSSGRRPTDKGYRFYVDYLVDVQRLAADEKERLEGQYKNRMEELDTLLLETSKLLSRLSHGAGLVLSPAVASAALKRLELIHLGGHNVLALLVTEAGFVRHWPIKLGFAPTARQINTLNRFLNENIRGCSAAQARTLVVAKLQQMEREFRELNVLARELLSQVSEFVGPNALYVEGADSLLSQAEEIGDLEAVQSLMRVLNEKRTIAGLLEQELGRREQRAQGRLKPSVRIGRESGVPELAGLSLITTVYQRGDQVLGVLGILGSKRMEYSRMMSLVDFMSDILSRKLLDWDEGDANE
ncbi:MAG: heat-inducible transcription repressor HrcA [Elusimicrobia bacterium]|nr:heat-inducible transcription repressor HrcA [Elusimicrobiota bacterium]MDE2237894.1 heat-inducible transcription repressor HrcA [Elusimicrobiota bacterium]MDE2424641.1 heat-inducible transcription repressor HrcA [Elusimicrobiota bacterium]